MSSRHYKRLRLGVFSFALLLLLLGVAAARLTYDFVQANRWVRHTEEVMNNVRGTRMVLGLSPLAQSTPAATVAAVRDRLDHMARLTLDNPRQQKNLAGLRAILALPAPTSADPFINFQPRNPDAVGAALDLMQREEYGLLLARSETEAKAMQRAGLAVLALCAALLALGALTSISARSEFLRREQVESILRIEKQELTHYTEELALISRGSEMLQSLKDEAQLGIVVARVLRDLLPESCGYLGLIQPAHAEVEIAESWNDAHTPRRFAIPSCPALQSGNAIHGARLKVLESCAPAASSAGDSLCLPIRSGDDLLGILHLHTPGPLLPRHADAVNLFAAHIALALTNLRIRAALHHQSVRDPLTGLFNRRYFDDTLDRELAACRRYNRSAAVLMLDLDHFKRINDTHGHAAGDEALRKFARLMRSAFRDSDVLCRYGGEEFAIILLNVELQDAYARAESFRNLVAQADLPDGLAITASIGLASSRDCLTPDQILRKADAALYHAKNSGRNRTCVSTPQESAIPKTSQLPPSSLAANKAHTDVCSGIATYLDRVENARTATPQPVSTTIA